MIWIIFILYAVFVIRFYRGILRKLKIYDIDYSEYPEKYQPFVRYDYKNWNHWEIYACAVFVLPVRLLGLICTLLPCLFILRVGSLGLPLQTQWPAKRYAIVQAIVKGLAVVYMFFSGFHNIKKTKVKYSTFDPSYKQSDANRVRRPAVIVSNHQSWYDTIFLVSQYMPSFLSKANVGNYPVFGPITTALKSVYVNRDDREGKDNVLDQIRQRQSNIDKGRLFPPIIIFPEGTSTNGQYLISFKKGAFESLQPVQIVCLRYLDRRFNLSLDKLNVLEVAALSLVQLQNGLEFFEFEGVYDPKHLGLHQYPEERRWEIYADRVRDIMCACLGKKKSSSGFRHTQELDKYFQKQELI